MMPPEFAQDHNRWKVGRIRAPRQFHCPRALVRFLTGNHPDTRKEIALAVNHNAARSRFEVELDGQVAAAEYQRDDHTITFTHTEVPLAHRGRGVGNQLARTAFDFARAEGLRVVTRCPFMSAWLRRHPEYQDLRNDPAGRE
jgi:hypothetical protein